MKKEIDIGRCLSDGWKLYKDNFALIFVSSLLASVVGMLTCGILWAPLSIGLLWIIDRIVKDDAQVPTAGDVFKGTQKFVPALLCFIIFIVIFAIASLLPVIGQIACMLLSPLLIYALCYIAFENAEVMDAIKRVINELVSGDILMAVVVGIVANIIGGLGGLLCGIGVIFTAPLTSIIYYFAYKQMRGGNDDVLDAEIVGETQPSDSDEVETDSGTQQ